MNATCIFPKVLFSQLETVPVIMYTVLKIYFLKIYDIFTFEVATAGILKFCLRDSLGERQQESLYKFFDAISDLCSDKQAVGNEDLQNNLNYACALMERDWPVSLQVSCSLIGKLFFSNTIYRKKIYICHSEVKTKNKYLLLTEFEGRTVSYGPSYFLLDLWPKRGP